LTDFADKYVIDIPFLQEVKTEDVHYIFGYIAHLKISDTGRGTTISAKECIDLTRVTHLPSEGRIAAVYETVSIVGLYTPSGFLKDRHLETL
jgi:exonuclease III